MTDTDENSIGVAILDKVLGQLVRKLQRKMRRSMINRRGQWLLHLVTYFIVLHNFEVILKRERDIARDSGYSVNISPVIQIFADRVPKALLS